jgi:hypothetical protein
MKQYYFFLAITFIACQSNQTLACNTCGCGVSNYHYGILPQYQRNFVGLRYRYRSFDSRLDGSHRAPYSYETFQSTELWGRFYPSERVQLFAFIPYNFNARKEGEVTTVLRGPGDAVISVNYNILNTYDSSTSNWKHNILVGGGIKLPTGKFDAMHDGATINQNFQLGTGSVDFLLNLIYTLRYKGAGLNAEFTYNYNTTNRDEYRFGNTTRAGLMAFFVPITGAVTIMPNVGASVETFKDNSQFDQPFPDSGGWALLYNVGVEVYVKRFAFGVLYNHPGRQRLFNGQVTANDRISAHLTFMF